MEAGWRRPGRGLPASSCLARVSPDSQDGGRLPGGVPQAGARIAAVGTALWDTSGGTRRPKILCSPWVVARRCSSRLKGGNGRDRGRAPGGRLRKSLEQRAARLEEPFEELAGFLAEQPAHHLRPMV